MALYNEMEPLEKIKVYNKNVGALPHLNTPGAVPRNGDTKAPSLEQIEPLLAECEHFVDCMSRGLRPKTDGYNGLEVVKVLEAADKSLHNSGGFVKLDNSFNNKPVDHMNINEIYA